MQVKTKTYEMVTRLGHAGIKCLECRMVSYSLDDRDEKYCGNCNKFHEEDL